jgi:hypothetical protein
MAADPLDQVLRLVADGKLTAEEAAPILAALDEGAAAEGAATSAQATAAAIRDRAHELADEMAEPSARPEVRTDAERVAGEAGPRRPATSLRIEVHDAGRNVVNLRLPLAVGRFALDRVPGLSSDQVTRIREAMNSGFRGPVLVVDDDGDGVRISLE